MRGLSIIVLLIFWVPRPAYLWGQITEGMRIQNHSPKYSIRQEISQAYELMESNPDSSRLWLLRLLKHSWMKNHPDDLRKCLVVLSYFHSSPELREQSLQFAKKAIQLSDTVNHKEDLFALYDNMGKIYSRQSRYQPSFDAHLKGARYASGFPVEQAKIENNMTGVLELIGKTDVALYYLERCLKTGAAYNNGQLWANSLINIARLGQGDPKANLKYLDSGLYIATQFKLYKSLYKGMLIKSALLVQHKKPQQALVVLKATDTLSRHITILPEIQLEMDRVAGMVYTALGQYALAEQLFLKSLKSNETYNWIYNGYPLTELYVAQGRYKEAFDTYFRLREIMDSVSANLMTIRVTDLELQHRLVAKDKELAEHKLLLSAQEYNMKLQIIWISIFASGALVLLGMLLLVRKNYRNRQKIAQAEQVNQRLIARIEGEELERKRIARELHDGVGSILSAAKMKMSSTPPTDPAQRLNYEEGVVLMDEAYSELRRTAHNLSPEILKSKGLTDTVALFCEKTGEANQIKVQFQHFGRLDQLEEEVSLPAYRMIQELMHNIVKHSCASEAIVQLSFQENRLDITVEDNGKGMPATNAAEGIGLANIKDRVKALGGHVEISSRADEGTAVYISMDLA